MSWTDSDITIMQRCVDKAAEQGTCNRRNVWAILFRTDGTEAWEGNNQPADGKSYCNEGLCARGKLGFDEVPAGAPYDGEHPCGYVHAEEVVVTAAGLKYAYRGVLFCNEPPCWQCTKLLVYVHLDTLHLPDGVVIDQQCSQLLNRAGVTVVYHGISKASAENTTGSDHGAAAHHYHELGDNVPG